MTKISPTAPFPTAREEVDASDLPQTINAQTASPAFRLAFEDVDFLLREDLRPIRLQLELLKPELLQQEHATLNSIIDLNPYGVQIIDAQGHHVRAAPEILAIHEAVNVRIADRGVTAGHGIAGNHETGNLEL